MNAVFLRFLMAAIVATGVAFGFQNCSEQMPPAPDYTDAGSGGPTGPPSGGNTIIINPGNPGGSPVPAITGAGVGWIDLYNIWIQGSNFAANAQVIFTPAGASNPQVILPATGATATAINIMVPATMVDFLNSASGLEIQVLNPATTLRSSKFVLYRPADKGRLAAVRYYNSNLGHMMVVTDSGSGVAGTFPDIKTGTGYVPEGVIFYGSSRATSEFSVPIYQCVRHSQGDKVFLTTQANCENVANAEKLSGAPWLYLSNSATGPTGTKVQITRCYHGGVDRHVFVNDASECAAFGYVAESWAGDSTALYGWVNPIN